MVRTKSKKKQTTPWAEFEEEILAKQMNFWMVKEMTQDTRNQEIRFRVLFSELAMFCIFLLLLSIIAYDMNPSIHYNMSRVVKRQFIFKKFMYNSKELEFDQISKTRQIWAYLQEVLIKGAIWDNWYNKNSSRFLYENKVISIPRLRQIRVKSNSCRIAPEFQLLISECFNAYVPDIEEKGTIESGYKEVNETLPKNWHWEHGENIGNFPFKGYFGTYPNGGYVQDLSHNRRRNIDLLKHLERSIWINRGTRVLFVDLTIYNLNLNIFTVVKLIFEFPAIGGIEPHWKIMPIQLLRYVTERDHFTLACEYMVFVYMAYYIFEQLRKIVFFREHILFQLWNYLDLLIILYCGRIAFYTRLIDTEIVGRLKNIEKNKTQFYGFQDFLHWQGKRKDASVILLLICWLKLSKFSHFYSSISKAVQVSVKYMAVYCLLLFHPFFAFVHLGEYLFAAQVKDFTNDIRAVISLIRMLTGDFQFRVLVKEFAVIGPWFFIAFVILILFILLNMFLVILNTAYCQEENATEVYYGLSNARFLLRPCIWFSYKTMSKKLYKLQLYMHHASQQKVLELLRRCAYTEIEIDIFKNRFRLDYTNVSEYGEALKQIICQLRRDGCLVDENFYRRPKPRYTPHSFYSATIINEAWKKAEENANEDRKEKHKNGSGDQNLVVQFAHIRNEQYFRELCKLIELPRTILSPENSILLNSVSLNSYERASEGLTMSVTNFAPTYTRRVGEWRRAYISEVRHLEERFLKPIVPTSYYRIENES